MRRRAVAALMLSLPGCATASLWDREFPSWVPMERHPVKYAGTVVHEQDGVLVAFQGADRGEGFVLQGKPGDASWRMQSPAGGVVACRVAKELAIARTGRAIVVDVRRLLDDDVQHAEARLTLLAPAHATAPAQVVDRAALAREALAVLAETRHEGSAFAAEPWLRVPPVLRRAVERVSGRYLRTVLGTGRPLHFASFVFVGADGLPRFEPGAAAVGALADAGATRADDWSALGSLALVLRVQRDGRDEYVRLAPEALRLWAVCELRDGWLRHESTWQLEPLPASRQESWHDELAVHLVRSEARYRRTTRAEHAAWAAVLLTPFAFAADLTVLLPWNLVAIATRTGEGFADEDVEWSRER